jgi:hypothetical protein
MLSHTMSQESETSSQDRKPPGSRSTRSRRRRDGITPPAHYHVPATVSAAELLDRGSDRQFRGLVQDLLTVSRRLEMARDYFGRLIKVTGPQYHLLMTVAQLQGALGRQCRNGSPSDARVQRLRDIRNGKALRAGLIEKAAESSGPARRTPEPDAGRPFEDGSVNSGNSRG